MRIAQVAPLQLDVPPRQYGGTERIISELTEALVRHGHDVTLFASGDSRTSARLVPFIPNALVRQPDADPLATRLALLTEVYRRASDFDVIHSHLECVTLPFTTCAGVATPTVLTFHSRLDTSGVARLLAAYPDANCISISDDQRIPAPDANWVATVYHGVDVDDFPYRREAGNYLVFVGRIAPEKGPDRAIEVAMRAGVLLKIAAKVDPADRAYFKQRIEPLLDSPLIEFLGPVDERRKRDLMARALALLLPIDWPEPFGIVFIEALACGTPVLTRPLGAAPEIIEDGATGFLRESTDALVEAVRDLPGISRETCRRTAEERFSTRRMARDYIAVYNRLCRGQGPATLAAL